jgi:hypothetical protein
MMVELHVLSVDMSRTWAHHLSDHNFCALGLGYRGVLTSPAKEKVPQFWIWAVLSHNTT